MSDGDTRAALVSDLRADLRTTAARLRRLLEREREAGLTTLVGTAPPVVAAPTPAPTSAPTSAPRPVAPPRAVATPRVAPKKRAFVPRVGPLDLPADALVPFGTLPGEVSGCTRCALAETRTCTVFGEGAANADLVFCGEAPGYEEDQSGRPFVGRAGELLTAMIVGGLRLRREDVFILNTLKCRPPNNRTPVPDELAACRPHLSSQLAVLKPRVIVALGNAATRSLLGATTGITRLRGRVLDAFGAKVVPTYHPAYLLRNPAAKREAWVDLQKVTRLLAESQ